MFELLGNENENKFSWELIGNVAQGRKNLGENMPVFVYRLFQYAIKDEITKRFGSEQTIDIFRKSGQLAGEGFSENLLNLSLEMDSFFAHLQKVFEDSKIGILRIEELNPETGRAVLTLGEDVDCSGLPVIGETVCNYDEGFLAGVLKSYTKKEYVVREVDCWGTGSRVCRFNAYVKE